MKKNIFTFLYFICIGIFIFGCSGIEKKNDSEDVDSIQIDDSAIAASVSAVAEDGRLPKNVDSRTRRVNERYRDLSRALHAGRSRDLVSHASQILTAHEEDVVALNALALFYKEGGRYGAAELLIRRALEKASTSAELHNNLGAVLMAQDDQDGAMKQFRRALSLNLDHPQANANLASILGSGGDCMRANRHFERAYRVLKNAPDMANNYAACLRQVGELKMSEKIFRELIKDKPTHLEGLVNLASLLIDEQGKTKEGLDIVYRAKFIETNNRRITDRLTQLERKARASH